MLIVPESSIQFVMLVYLAFELLLNLFILFWLAMIRICSL